MKKVLNLPLTYEEAGFNDDRFTKVRVKVQHNGTNLNKSSFSDISIGKAAPSLRNVPLLAFVKKTDGTDQADFAGHEFEFKITEDGIKYVYLGRPIGMIPETNNYTYGEDEEGIKTVSADAYIWNQYANEALDIIRRDGGKSVSMEITVDNFEVDDKAGVMDITDFKYTGIAILGDDVQPAMRNARLDLTSFSFNGVSEFMASFSKEIKETLNNEKPEGIPVSEVTIIPPTDSQEEDGTKDEVIADSSTGTLEGEGQNSPPESENNPETDVERESGSDLEETIEPTVEQETEVESPLGETAPSPLGEPSDALGEPSNALGEIAPSPLGESSPAFTTGTITISDIVANSMVDFNGIAVGSVISAVDTNINYTQLIAENAALKTEVESLRAYKVAAEKAVFEAKVAELVQDFSDLPKEDVDNLINTETNYENIELKLYAMRGRLNTQTPAKKLQSYAIFDSSNSQDQPSWVKLVERYKNKKSTEGGN